MNGNNVASMVLAIGARDDFLHIYPSDQQLLQDDTIGTDNGELSGPLEFFDSEGHRLAGEFDREWRLLRLVPTAEPPDPALVRRRLRNALDHLRQYISSHPERLVPFEVTVEEVLAALPNLDDPAVYGSPLAELFTALADSDHSPEIPFNPGSPTHNMKHAAGWQH